MSVDQTLLPERVDVLVVGGGMAGLAAAENGAWGLVKARQDPPRPL